MKKAFTLAEVLITLAIIGVIAAISVPSLIQKTNQAEMKTAYKKAFAQMSQAIDKAAFDGVFTSVTAWNDANHYKNFDAVMPYFKTIKTCTSNNASNCWDFSGEFMTPGSASYPVMACHGFIDASGMAWIIYNNSESIYIVDVNGFKKPNVLGKDRWVVYAADDTGNRSSGTPTQILPWGDVTGTNWDCHNPPCYYTSALTGKN